MGLCYRGINYTLQTYSKSSNIEKMGRGSGSSKEIRSAGFYLNSNSFFFFLTKLSVSFRFYQQSFHRLSLV